MEQAKHGLIQENEDDYDDDDDDSRSYEILLNMWPTTRSRIFLENIMVVNVVKKLHSFMEFLMESLFHFLANKRPFTLKALYYVIQTEIFGYFVSAEVYHHFE
jgi:hypothetical protein